MATHFSANQYEKSFAANRLQNWQIPSKFKEHPSSKVGYTKIISNDRGHLHNDVARSKESPWGQFKGTWDMQMDCRHTVHCQTLTTLKSEGASCLKPGAKSLVRPDRVNEIMKAKLQMPPFGNDHIDKGTPNASRQGTPPQENDLVRPESVHSDQDRKQTPEGTPIKDIGTPVKDISSPVGSKPVTPINQLELA